MPFNSLNNLFADSATEQLSPAILIQTNIIAENSKSFRSDFMIEIRSECETQFLSQSAAFLHKSATF